MIKREIFDRYAALQVPRYTSYPTAPHFLPTADDSVHLDWLREADAADPISLYLHVPFCRHMCWYCGCHTTVVRRDEPVTRYVSELAREIRLVEAALPERLTVAHLHWGGGTPTLLDPALVRILDRRLRRSFLFSPNAEVGLEVDPRALTEAIAAAYVEMGVNRVSIGVQTFDPVVQEAIHRVQPLEQTIAAVSLFRRLGIRGVNFDLIYGLPYQTTASCLATVRHAVLLRPDRLAVFGYAHVPSFKPHQRNIHESTLPSTSARLEQAEAMAEALIAEGYEQVGLDHFALPDDPLALAAKAGSLHRNFQGYTTDPCTTLIGFGASAISRLPAGFVQNATRIPEYQRQVASGHLPTARLCPIGAEDARRARIIEQLMCNYRADIGTLSPVHIRKLERDGLVRRRGSLIEVPEEARPLVRVVAAAFDTYLGPARSRHTRAV